MSASGSISDRLFFDLSPRVKLRVSGADCVRFLNGQMTNDVRKATESSALEACVLNAKGKMDAHVFVHRKEESFLVDADPALGATLQARLDRYIIADDVQITDVTQELSMFHMIGAEASNFSSPSRVISADRFGAPGLDLWCPSKQREQIADELAREFTFCGDVCAEQLRIEHGIPRWGRELTPEIIPVEANLERRCIDYDKGCYIGQETISRMKMSGQRNKQLCGLRWLSGSELKPEMRLIAGAERKDAGWITSVAQTGNGRIALGYVKRGFNSAGTKLVAAGSEPVQVEVVDLPFAD